MNNFDYYTPTKVIFGKGAQERVGEEISADNCTKVLVHYGGASAEKSGLLGRVCDSLEKAGVEYVKLGGVVPNPLLGLVYEGIELCKKENVEHILAVGGGSVIDSSKAIALGAANDCDVWDIFLRKVTPKKALPVSAVVTIAAAGSEMSDSAVITREEGLLKRGFNSNLIRCKTAFMNPELTYTLPAYQTASGIVDIMMHTMERYFVKNTMEITDSIAESLLKTVISQAETVMKEPDNYDARAEIMWAGSLSHNGLTECGGVKDFSCHALEHELSGMFNVAHGAGLAAVWSSWARYIYKECPERFTRFAVNVMGIDGSENIEETALKGIEAVEKFFMSIGMPVRVSGFGIELTDEQIRELAVKCSFHGARKVGVTKVLDVSDMENIYKMAR